MKVLNFVKRIRLCSGGSIAFHVYDRQTGLCDKIVLSMAEIADMELSCNPLYPLSCMLENVDLIDGLLVVNCSK